MSTLVIETTRNVVVVDANEYDVLAEAVRYEVTVNPATTLSLIDSVYEVTSGSSLSALRVVTHDGQYADPDDYATVGVAGITVTAGTTVNARFGGRMIDAGWSWTPGQPIYCGANGVLTHTAPVTGWIRRVAEAVSATEIIVNIHQPIVRN